MFHSDPFSNFYSGIRRQLEVRVRRAVPAQDSEDVLQAIWGSFWVWLNRQPDRTPERHAGMLMEFAEWRIRTYFRHVRRAPQRVELPVHARAADDSPFVRAAASLEGRRAEAFFARLAACPGGRVLPLLRSESRRLGTESALEEYGFVRAYLEKTLPAWEREQVSGSLLAQISSRSALDVSVSRLRASWSMIAPEFQIPMLQLARPAPRRKVGRGVEDGVGFHERNHNVLRCRFTDRAARCSRAPRILSSYTQRSPQPASQRRRRRSRTTAWLAR
ncbi:MAG: hypothetical protein JNL98_04150 [Bryobacterales bacterium]|nr:hypothetical protein [Bryobacterales bacterium]